MANVSDNISAFSLVSFDVLWESNLRVAIMRITIEETLKPKDAPSEL